MQAEARAPALPSGRGFLEQALVRLTVPVLVLLAWQLAGDSSADMARSLPTPVVVLSSLWGTIANGTLATHVGYSLARAMSGFAAAGLAGLFFGLLMSRSRTIRYVLSGPVELLRPISPIAWVPLSILWFGIGFTSIVFIIFISCVFIVLINTLSAASRVDHDLVKAARVLGAGGHAVFWKVVIPGALPGMLLGLRLALSGAWGGVLIAELIAAQQGLGYMVGRAQATRQPDLIIGGMLVIGVVGYLLNAIFVWLQRKVTHQHG